MGESYFELEYTQTPEHLKELYRFTFFRKPSSLVMIISICCMLFVHVFFSMILFGVEPFDVALLVTLLVLISLRVLMYKLTVKHSIKRQLEICGGQFVQVRMGLYNDSFVMNESSGAQFTIDYCSIKCCYQTKNLFLLLSKANLVYSFHKDAFTKGNPIYFIPFIASRGVKVKGVNKQ